MRGRSAAVQSIRVRIPTGTVSEVTSSSSGYSQSTKPEVELDAEAHTCGSGRKTTSSRPACASSEISLEGGEGKGEGGRLGAFDALVEHLPSM